MAGKIDDWSKMGESHYVYSGKGFGIVILDGIVATLAAGTKIPKIKQGRGLDVLMVKVIERRLRWLYETWKPSSNASIQCGVFILGPLVILF